MIIKRILYLLAVLIVLSGCSQIQEQNNKYNSADSVGNSDTICSSSAEKSIIDDYLQPEVDYYDLCILDADDISYTDNTELFRHRAETTRYVVYPKERVQTSYNEIFEYQNENLNELYISVHINFVKSVSFVRRTVNYEIIEYSDGTVEKRRAPVENFKILGYSIIDVTINDFIYSKGSCFRENEEDFKKINGTTFDVFSTTFWRPDNSELIRYSEYLQVNLTDDPNSDIIPTAYVPKPDTDIIIPVGGGMPWIFGSADSFINKAEEAQKKVSKYLFSDNATAESAYTIGFDYDNGVTNVSVKSLWSFWSAYDLNGNRITDEQSFRSYLLYLDDLYKKKASEDPEFVWEQGYVGIFDPDNIILKKLSLGFVGAD